MITRRLYRCQDCAHTVTVDAARGRALAFAPACPGCDRPMIRQAAGRVPSCRSEAGQFDPCATPDLRRGEDRAREVIEAGRAVVGAARVVGSLLRGRRRRK